MDLNLMKTLKSIEKFINEADFINIEKIKKAYSQTLKLRSQLISVIYDIEEYIEIKDKEAGKQNAFQNIDKDSITLVINEPLPSMKELTLAVEEHWVNMINKAIAEESKTGIPKFDKAFVMIEITTPRGTRNRQVWDTSNRAINVIINNLKGIFFKDDNFEHMAFGVAANWGEEGKTVIKVCDFEEFFAQKQQTL